MTSRCSRLAAAVLCTVAAGAWATAAVSAAPTPSPPPHAGRPTRAEAEAAFLKTVNNRNSSYVVTGDLAHYAGTHVAYTCSVDAIVRPGVILGQCGAEAEPVDLFVELPTEHLRAGDKLRVLGVMERPATWTDVTGHTVYYAFVRAVFVDPAR